MEALEAIRQRRSVRTFAETPVSDEQVDSLLRAAMAAPSAGNEQSWRFVVVRDNAMLAQLGEATPYSKPVGRAPLAIVVLGDTTCEKHPGNWSNDCAAATENILLAAHALGLGACWIGVYPNDEREAAVGQIVDMPKDFRAFCMIAVGVPEGPGPKPDRYNNDYVRHERWSD